MERQRSHTQIYARLTTTTHNSRHAPIPAYVYNTALYHDIHDLNLKLRIPETPIRETETTMKQGEREKRETRWTKRRPASSTTTATLTTSTRTSSPPRRIVSSRYVCVWTHATIEERHDFPGDRRFGSSILYTTPKNVFRMKKKCNPMNNSQKQKWNFDGLGLRTAFIQIFVFQPKVIPLSS